MAWARGSAMRLRLGHGARGHLLAGPAVVGRQLAGPVGPEPVGPAVADRAHVTRSPRTRRRPACRTVSSSDRPSRPGDGDHRVLGGGDASVSRRVGVGSSPVAVEASSAREGGRRRVVTAAVWRRQLSGFEPTTTRRREAHDHRQTIRPRRWPRPETGRPRWVRGAGRGRIHRPPIRHRAPDGPGAGLAGGRGHLQIGAARLAERGRPPPVLAPQVGQIRHRSYQAAGTHLVGLVHQSDPLVGRGGQPGEGAVRPVRGPSSHPSLGQRLPEHGDAGVGVTWPCRATTGRASNRSRRGWPAARRRGPSGGRPCRRGSDRRAGSRRPGGTTRARAAATWARGTSWTGPDPVVGGATAPSRSPRPTGSGPAPKQAVVWAGRSVATTSYSRAAAVGGPRPARRSPPEPAGAQLARQVAVDLVELGAGGARVVGGQGDRPRYHHTPRPTGRRWRWRRGPATAAAPRRRRRGRYGPAERDFDALHGCGAQDVDEAVVSTT